MQDQERSVSQEICSYFKNKNTLSLIGDYNSILQFVLQKPVNQDNSHITALISKLSAIHLLCMLNRAAACYYFFAPCTNILTLERPPLNLRILWRYIN